MVGIGWKNVHFDSLLGLSTQKTVKCYPTRIKEQSFLKAVCNTPQRSDQAPQVPVQSHCYRFFFHPSYPDPREDLESRSLNGGSDKVPLVV